MDDVAIAPDFQAALGSGLHHGAARDSRPLTSIGSACRVGRVIPMHSKAAVLVGFQQGVLHMRLSESLGFDWVNHAAAGAPPLRLNDANSTSATTVWPASTSPPQLAFRLPPLH